MPRATHDRNRRYRKDRQIAEFVFERLAAERRAKARAEAEQAQATEQAPKPAANWEIGAAKGTRVPLDAETEARISDLFGD